MIALGAMFRTSAGYIDTYFDQVSKLEKLLADRGQQVRFIFAENDSTDDTPERLAEFGNDHDVTVIDRSEGGPHYPSREIPARWKHIAHVCNGVLEEVREDDDLFLYVECDLLWQPKAMLRLLDHVRFSPATSFVHGTPEQPIDAVSCLCLRPDGGYYDTWGSRKDGKRFSARPPFHPALVNEKGVVEMDSVASVLACRAEVARATRFSEREAFVGWCKDIRAHGWRIWLDPSVEVIHP